MSKQEEMLEQLDHPRSSGPTKAVTLVVAIVGVAAVGFLAWYLHTSLNTIKDAVARNEAAVNRVIAIVGAQQEALSARIVELEDFIREQGQTPPDNRGDLDEPAGGGGGQEGGGQQPKPKPTAEPSPKPSPRPSPSPQPKPEEPSEEPTEGPGMDSPDPLICVDNPLDGVICVGRPNPVVSTLGGIALGGVGLLILRRNATNHG